MPTIEQLYDKLCLLEQQLKEVRDGMALSDDLIVDFFNINTVPGREAENPRIDLLDNVQLINGVATIINPLLGEGYLQTATSYVDVEDIQSVELRPHNEDVKCQVVVTPNSQKQEVVEQWLSLVTTDAQHVDIVANSGQRDYGAKLQLESNDKPYLQRLDFADGELAPLWFPERRSILWEAVDVVGNGNMYDYVLQCEATEPLQQFPLPQYSLFNYGMAIWSDVLLKETNSITTSFKQVSGGLVRVGLAMNMADELNGLLVMLEMDLNGSWARLYKVDDGFLVLLQEESLSFSLANDVEYEIFGSVINNEVIFNVDGNNVLTHELEPLEIVNNGEFGLIVKASSLVQFKWVEVGGTHEPVFISPEGLVHTETFTSGTDIEVWEQIELDTSIISGQVSVEYSLDGGATFSPIPMAIINYPDAITKRFNIDFIPVTAGFENSITFRIKLDETGVGWVRRMAVSYRATPTEAYILENMVVTADGFRLLPGQLDGKVEMIDDIEPDQIYSWDKVVRDEYRASQFVPIASIVNQATVIVDSEQAPHTGDLIVDASMDTYWESMRGENSYVIFEFPAPVEITGFRWVKKAVTEGAVYYRAQYYDATQNKYIDIHSYGYEVNADIRHDFPQAVVCQKFRIMIDCVQPMSFGNARFIDLFGRTLGGKVTINYEYSSDAGVSWVPINSLLSLADVPTELNIRLRAIVHRDDALSDVFLRSFGARFSGRSRKGIQLTNIIYDIQLGNREIYDFPINEEIDMRGVLGSNFQLAARFIIHPDYGYEQLKPKLSGYKFAVSSSKYQTQIDRLSNHINSVLLRADRDPQRDVLADAVVMLIGHELDKERQSNGEAGSVIHGLLNVLQREISSLRSRMVVGDVGHLDEALPSIVRKVNILE